MRSIRLTTRIRFGRGGTPVEGRRVGGVQAQVVPRGTVRSIMAKHRREGSFRGSLGDDTAAAELAHREKTEAEVRSPSQPDSWSVERGRRQLLDLEARARKDV